jgi:hypothetical protein
MLINASKQNTSQQNQNTVALPIQVSDKTWRMDKRALENTLKYVFEHLHHTCYLLCVTRGRPTMYKLESNSTAPIFEHVFKQTIEKKLIQGQKADQIKKTIQTPVRVMQCIVKKLGFIGEQEQNEYITYFDDSNIILPNGVYLFNLTDALILRKDRDEPFPMVFKNIDKNGIEKFKFHHEEHHIPIFSMSGQNGYADIPIPNYDDINCKSWDTTNFITEWKKKDSNGDSRVAVFRGSPSGCGYNLDTNMRMKLVKNFKNVVNAEIVFNEERSNINTDSIRFDPEHGLGSINSDIIPGTKMSMTIQSSYKYIVHIDGNVNAYRLLQTMLTGSLILRVDSEYTSWLDHFLKDEKYFVSVAKDLSNLERVIIWCNENSQECLEIANRALKLAEKIVKPGFISNYIEKIMNSVASSSSPHSHSSSSPLLPPHSSPLLSPHSSPLLSPHSSSPPYSPDSPPYSPDSPPYSPASPPYSPASPPYSPDSAPYSPDSAPYSPLYSISPPAYSPSSPLQTLYPNPPAYIPDLPRQKKSKKRKHYPEGGTIRKNKDVYKKKTHNKKKCYFRGRTRKFIRNNKNICKKKTLYNKGVAMYHKNKN